MKIILNSMYQKRLPSEIKIDKNAQLEVFLFKYLHNKDLITHEDFKKTCGNSLSGIKFPVEFQVKLNHAYARTLWTFLTEKNDLSFLSLLKQDYPEHYDKTEHYLKQFYYNMICNLLNQIKQNRWKDISIKTSEQRIKIINSFSVNAPGLARYLQHILNHPGDPFYNSFIISGNEFGGTLALEWLKAKLTAKYPGREILHLPRYAISDFLRNKPAEMLVNYTRLHPNLLCVLVTDLEEDRLKNEEQNKLALFLKSLTKYNIQVAISSSIIVNQGYSNSSSITPELWSLYMSGREYCLRAEFITYNKDLTRILKPEQNKKHFKPFSYLSRILSCGKPALNILRKDTEDNFHPPTNMDLIIAPMGVYNPPCHIFPRAQCPSCGKVELIPYSCFSSAFSGCHTIHFYCSNCFKRWSTQDLREYFHIFRLYGTRTIYRKNN